MSGGGWNYNRFDAYEAKLAEAKKADKDYDGDGKVESSKDEYFGSKDKAIKKAMGKGTCKKCEESKEDCECDDKKEVKEAMTVTNADKKGNTPAYQNYKKGMKNKDGKPVYKAADHMKEEVIDEASGCGGYQEGGEVKAKKKKVVKEDVLGYILENNLANNEVSAEVLFNCISDEFLESIEEDIMEIYQGKHGQSEKQYQDGRSPAGKMISGDSKGSGANYSYRAKNTGPNPAGGSQKPQGQAKMNNKDRAFLSHLKANKKANK